jgi:hypothetical protein
MDFQRITWRYMREGRTLNILELAIVTTVVRIASFHIKRTLYFPLTAPSHVSYDY